jgi:hypothetical protein
MKGRPHAKNAGLSPPSKDGAEEPEPSSLRCDICNFVGTSKTHYDAHINGKPHANKAAFVAKFETATMDVDEADAAPLGALPVIGKVSFVIRRMLNV